MKGHRERNAPPPLLFGSSAFTPFIVVSNEAFHDGLLVPRQILQWALPDLALACVRRGEARMKQVLLVVDVVPDDIHGPDFDRCIAVVHQDHQVSPVPMRIGEKLDLKLLHFRACRVIVRHVVIIAIPKY